ncbi:MAG: heme exporter protein CcmB [Firmicutes bacterium]|nr:heme exporter protein CcmB [Bacillota bacterium]
MSFWRAVLAIYARDLTIASRRGEAVAGTLVFSLLAVTLFRFAFDQAVAAALPQLFPGLLWLVLYFAGFLGIYRSFHAEVRDQVLAGLLLAPVDPAAVFYGKLLANLTFLALAEAVAVPFLFVFFGYHPSGSASLLPLVGVLALGTLAFAAAATFVAAVAAGTRAGEVLVPVLLFPLLIPAALASIAATRGVLIPGGADVTLWVRMLLAYTAVFLVLPWLLFEHLMEV